MIHNHQSKELPLRLTQVLRYYVEGKDNSEIAKELLITEDAVHKYIQRIKKHFGMKEGRSTKREVALVLAGLQYLLLTNSSQSCVITGCRCPYFPHSGNHQDFDNPNQ